MPSSAVATGGGRSTPSLRKYTPKVPPLSDEIRRHFSQADLRILEFRLKQPAECIYHPRFAEPRIEEELLGPLPPTPGELELEPGPDNDDSGLDLLRPRSGRTLSTEQEQHMFLRYNYCRWRVMKILKAHRNRPLDLQAARELLRWEKAALRARSDLVRVNLPLVLAMAKRTRITGVDPADLISEGNLALLRSVDKFDCARGYKFSTYACRSILKAFSRVAVRTARYRGHFPTEFDPTLEKSDYLELKRRHLESDCIDELRAILGKNLAGLNPVEETVIRARFALDDDSDQRRAKTLEQVGEMIGVTKERVRQIQNKALGKLRVVLEEGLLAV